MRIWDVGFVKGEHLVTDRVHRSLVAIKDLIPRKAVSIRQFDVMQFRSKENRCHSDLVWLIVERDHRPETVNNKVEDRLHSGFNKTKTEAIVEEEGEGEFEVDIETKTLEDLFLVLDQTCLAQNVLVVELERHGFSVGGSDYL